MSSFRLDRGSAAWKPALWCGAITSSERRASFFKPFLKNGSKKRIVDVEVRGLQSCQSLSYVDQPGLGGGAEDAQRPRHPKASSPGFRSTGALVDQKEIGASALGQGNCRALARVQLI